MEGIEKNKFVAKLIRFKKKLYPEYSKERRIITDFIDKIIMDTD